MQKPGNFRLTAPRQTAISIGMDSVLRVRNQCRFRNDFAMGIVNTGGIKNTFVGHNTLRLLQEVSKRQTFKPEELKVEYSIEMKNSDYLCFLDDLVCKNVLELAV